jgi:DNA-binding protein HU-beta
VNKAELIEALAGRLGDKRTASTALDAVLAEIQSAVTKGDKVSLTGFGVFEKRVRAARMARNPRTGAAVRVKKTSVPAFRAGAGFKDMVASGKVPRVAKAATAKKAAPAAKKAAPANKAAAKKAAPAKKATAKKTSARKAPAKTARAATTTTTGARKTATVKTAAKKAPAKRASRGR